MTNLVLRRPRERACELHNIEIEWTELHVELTVLVETLGLSLPFCLSDEISIVTTDAAGNSLREKPNEARPQIGLVFGRLSASTSRSELSRIAAVGHL